MLVARLISAHVQQACSGRVGLRIDSRGALALIIPRGGAPQLPSLLLTRQHLRTRKPNSQDTNTGPHSIFESSEFAFPIGRQAGQKELAHLQVPLKLRAVNLPIPLKTDSLRRAIRISAIRWGWRIRVGRIRMGRIMDAWLEICAGFQSFEANSDQLGPILAPSPHTGA